MAQDYFREMTDQSVREELYEEDKEGLEADMAPFGFILDGSNEDTIVDKKDNLVWTGGDRYDEYGVAYSPWSWEQRTYGRDNYGGDPSWWRDY